MSYKVTVQPSGQVFEASADQTLLDASLAEGMMLRHSCREGTCGTCKGQVVIGQIDHAESDLAVLTQAERNAGLALFCRAKACSDLEIYAPEVTELRGISIQKTAARVASIERCSADVAIVRLQLPPAVPFHYFPGQYTEVILKDGSRRSYSMATVPQENNQLEWHIRNTGGAFSRYVYEELKEKILLRLEGPFGTFYLRDTQRPIVCVASGTGFAPIKALLEQLVLQNTQRSVHLYWGGRQLSDLYMHDWVTHFAAQYPWFTYIPVLSEESEETGWDGATGFVHTQVVKDFSDLSDYEAYVCGNPRMVESARKDFIEKCALDEASFFADAFI